MRGVVWIDMSGFGVNGIQWEPTSLGTRASTPSSSHSVERESPVAGGPKDPGRYPSVRAVATVSRKGVAGADGLLCKENVSRRSYQLRWPV